jgi:hypothetical protein
VAKPSNTRSEGPRPSRSQDRAHRATGRSWSRSQEQGQTAQAHHVYDVHAEVTRRSLRRAQTRDLENCTRQLPRRCVHEVLFRRCMAPIRVRFPSNRDNFVPVSSSTTDASTSIPRVCVRETTTASRSLIYNLLSDTLIWRSSLHALTNVDSKLWRSLSDTFLIHS